MKPPRFAYERATSVQAALQRLASHGPDIKLLAGGQSLMPMLNFRLLRPLLLLDINHLAELQQLQLLDDGTLRLGALLRHQQVLKAPQVQQHWPVMAAALAQIGHLAIRNRGTLGGSLSHADPAAEWPLLALLLQARLHLASAEGSRCLEAAEFITGAMSTALASQELLTAVDFPALASGHGWGFAEHARRSGDFAIAAAGVLLWAEAGRITQVRIAVGGGVEGACRVPGAEAALLGCPLGMRPEDAVLQRVLDALRASVQPNVDLHASAALRAQIMAAMLRQALLAAWARLSGTGGTDQRSGSHA